MSSREVFHKNAENAENDAIKEMVVSFLNDAGRLLFTTRENIARKKFIKKAISNLAQFGSISERKDALLQLATETSAARNLKKQATEAKKVVARSMRSTHEKLEEYIKKQSRKRTHRLSSSSDDGEALRLWNARNL